MRLYHYTCSHAAPLIVTDGFLRTHPQPQLVGESLIWLTDMEWPDRLALGLTSHTLRCDRTEWRVTVDTDAQRWAKYARSLARILRHGLEWAPGARPMHWWVATENVPTLRVEATYDSAPLPALEFPAKAWGSSAVRS